MFLHHPGVFQKMIYLTAALCRGPWGCSFILALCLVSEAKAFVASRISVALQLQQRCGGNCAARLNPIGILANPRRCARQRLLRMDDEVSRPGIREVKSSVLFVFSSIYIRNAFVKRIFLSYTCSLLRGDVVHTSHLIDTASLAAT